MHLMFHCFHIDKDPIVVAYDILKVVILRGWLHDNSSNVVVPNVDTVPGVVEVVPKSQVMNDDYGDYYYHDDNYLADDFLKNSI